MAEADLTNLGTVTGRSASGVLSSGANGDLAHNVSSGNETWLVKSLILSNNNSTAGLDIETDVFVNVNGTNRYLMYRTWVPYGTSLVVLDESLPIYLNYPNYIRVSSVTGGGLNYVFKYETLRE